MGWSQSRAQLEQQFSGWLQGTVWPAARQQGVAQGTFNAALGGVTPQWDLPGLRGGSGGSQAEFGSPGKYFSRGKVDGATSTGRQMAQKYGRTLAAVERATGVPGRTILAIWGIESSYGRAKIPHDVFRILATRGFLSDRRAYFTNELIAALKIAQTSRIAPASMRSSWAGAMGQPQFMPSNYLKYAADGDGDGRADIWRSDADTMASIGNFLARHGWQRGRDWGFEVVVPPSVSCTLEGPDQGRRISDWAKMGVRRVNGKPFPNNELRGEGYLMMPAGRNGPAFIVTPNFYVLKDYNMSDLYALFVGHVGDRIQYGVGDFAGRWGKVGGLSRRDVAAMQRGLERQGHDVGGADGLAGFKTRRSIGRWQEATGQAATCFPEASMKRALAR
ncbi:lytic murein transglycosylase [Palleronia caenipelagi]|uniref:Lytic murein transglycosylase n=1 Tax=Palleronia caenipelagi TaxID=2489174 RepID=A0A547Q5D6_9RHOB|nr:lytic murein transglycosylase [Palleronia caenipelagi]TRD21600.1 lytic murein transglycosylase [Palleronia caenipelagi]